MPRNTKPDPGRSRGQHPPARSQRSTPTPRLCGAFLQHPTAAQHPARPEHSGHRGAAPWEGARSAAAPAAAGDGSLPARAAPGAGCSARGSATRRSRGCCRPAGRDASQTPAPAGWRGPGACPAQGTWATPGRSPAAAWEEAMPQRTPLRGRGAPPSLPSCWQSSALQRAGTHRGPSRAPCRAGHRCGSWFASQAPAPACRHRSRQHATHCLDPPRALPQSTQLGSAGTLCSSGGQHPQHPGEGQAPRAPRPTHATSSPRQAEPRPPARPGAGGAAVSSRGLRVSK